MQDLGRALRARRRERGLSQEAVCRSAGVARSWLSKVEAGRHGGAELQKVLDLAAVLGLSLTLTHDSAERAHEPAPGTPTPQARQTPSPQDAPTPLEHVAPEPSPQAAPRPPRVSEGDPFEHLFG